MYSVQLCLCASFLTCEHEINSAIFVENDRQQKENYQVELLWKILKEAKDKQPRKDKQ